MGRFDKLRELNIKETKQRIKDSVQADDLVIQSINLIDDSKRAANIMVKRLREWYELYNPEFSRELVDQEKFAELVSKSEDKKIKNSMGADLSKKDLDSIRRLAKKTNDMYEFIHSNEDYLAELMKKECPNITAVAGHLVGAKLIELAGGLRELVLFPSSTVQILGAEKALFRHLKTKARMPKHGVIIQHPLLAEAPAAEKGKRARSLADKILIAAKLDFFKGKFLGNQLRDELERKFK